MKKTITIKSSNGGPDRTVRLKYSPVMLHLMGGTYAREVDRLCKPLTGISTHANGTAQHPADAAVIQTAEASLYALVDRMFGAGVAAACFAECRPFARVKGDFFCTQVVKGLFSQV